MFAPLNLADVRTIDFRHRCKFFLGDPSLQACSANSLSERQRGLRLVGGRADRAASLDGALLHRQKRRSAR